GAAIKDILSTIKRRYPICETILFPSLVQGSAAAPDIVKQIEKAQEYNLDVLIVGRGGGSIEDLWAFNEEIVARAIYSSSVPVISAVGHEVDYTIADYVADLRAPTPTGAAEMAVPVLTDVLVMLDNYKIRLRENILKTLKQSELRLNKVKDSFILSNPLAMYEVKEEKLNNYVMVLNNYISDILLKKKHTLKLDLNTLKLLNPVNIMEKGYSLVKIDDKIIKDTKNLNVNDKVEIKLYKGEVIAEVKEIK
nr:exodeoxyribonuclease VII large subunit [Bacilli bacterium]